jgi:hypothetical protein
MLSPLQLSVRQSICTLLCMHPLKCPRFLISLKNVSVECGLFCNVFLLFTRTKSQVQILPPQLETPGKPGVFSLFAFRAFRFFRPFRVLRCQIGARRMPCFCATHFRFTVSGCRVKQSVRISRAADALRPVDRI